MFEVKSKQLTLPSFDKENLLRPHSKACKRLVRGYLISLFDTAHSVRDVECGGSGFDDFFQDAIQEGWL